LEGSEVLNREGLSSAYEIPVVVPTITGDPRDGRNDRGCGETGRRGLVPHLRVKCRFQVGDEDPYRVRALIDTGAEVSLVRKGLVESQYLQPSRIPLLILGANNRRVIGGTLQVSGLLEFDATAYGSHEPVRHIFPTTLHEADITEDIIFSYSFLAYIRLEISPWRHGLELKMDGRRSFIEGLPKEPRSTGNARGLQPRVLPINSLERTRDESPDSGTRTKETPAGKTGPNQRITGDNRTKESNVSADNRDKSCDNASSSGGSLMRKRAFRNGMCPPDVRKTWV